MLSGAACGAAAEEEIGLDGSPPVLERARAGQGGLGSAPPDSKAP